MSRGHGYVQRFVLAELDARWARGDPWVDTRTLAERLEDGVPTTRGRRSVARALRRLAADGLVEVDARGRRIESRVAPARVEDVELRHVRRERARELRRLLRGG